VRPLIEQELLPGVWLPRFAEDVQCIMCRRASANASQVHSPKMYVVQDRERISGLCRGDARQVLRHQQGVQHDTSKLQCAMCA
jgi:hypothetical protein